jgi:protein-S-isoprenylcysteine O-methyltransferase Ste14
MTPGLLILTVMIVGGWFVGIPFAIASNPGYSWAEGFGLVLAVTIGTGLFVGFILLLDAWWLKGRHPDA